MKTTKIIIIATIATILLIALCGVATANAETYDLTAVVIGYEQIGDLDLYIINLMSVNGDELDFLGEAEDAHIGNLYRVTMLDMSEEHEEADEISDVELITRLDTMEMMSFLRGVKW